MGAGMKEKSHWSHEKNSRFSFSQIQRASLSLSHSVSDKDLVILQ